jgi:hypothetical protein
VRFRLVDSRYQVFEPADERGLIIHSLLEPRAWPLVSIGLKALRSMHNKELAFVAEDALRLTKQGAQAAARGCARRAGCWADEGTEDALKLRRNLGDEVLGDDGLYNRGLLGAEAGFVLQQIGDFTHEFVFSFDVGGSCWEDRGQ